MDRVDDTVALLDVLRRGNPRACACSTSPACSSAACPPSPPPSPAAAPTRASSTRCRALRFPIVARLDELLVDESGPTPTARGRARQAVLAALVLDVAGLDADGPPVPRLLDELAVDEPAAVEHLLTAARLLRAAAGDLDGYDRAELLQLASSIGSIASCRRPTCSPSPARPTTTAASASTSCTRLVADVLAHPDLLDGDATTLADARRRAAQSLAAEPPRSPGWRPRPTATSWPTSPTSWPARPGSSSRSRRVAPSAWPSARRARPTTGSSTSPAATATGCSPTSPAR